MALCQLGLISRPSADVVSARADVAFARADIRATRSDVVGARADVAAARADVAAVGDRLSTDNACAFARSDVAADLVDVAVARADKTLLQAAHSIETFSTGLDDKKISCVKSTSYDEFPLWISIDYI